MRYRKDIQILRGLAVTMVLLFHLDLPVVKAGFLGVDIFFVISGFLMASLYEDGKVLEFYKRRFRRLLPAYYFTIVGTLIFCAIVTLPGEFNQVVNQALFGVVFSSNIGFWQQNSYFSKAEFNPLLHLWSLGAEIQFYLFFPLINWLIGHKKKVFTLVCLSSALACFYVSAISPKTSFFMMPLRLWEFLIGFGVQRFLIDWERVGAVKIQRLGSVCLIIVAALGLAPVDGEHLGFLRGHPGFWALVACFATAGVLCCGLPSGLVESKLGRVLEVAGTYSYSIYLVHYPILVVALYTPFSGTVNSPKSAISAGMFIGLILVTSFLVHQHIENAWKNRTRLALMTLTGSISVLASCLLCKGIQNHRFTEAEMKIFSAWSDRDIYRCGKIFRILHPTDSCCDLTPDVKENASNILFLGDSHADSIKRVLADEASSVDMRLFFHVSNTPLLPNGPTISQILDQVKRYEISWLILHYSSGQPELDILKEFLKVCAERQIGVSFIMPTPDWSVHVPRALYENLSHGTDLPTQTANDYWAKNTDLKEMLGLIHFDGVKTYDVVNEFGSKSLQLISSEGHPFYFDNGHLTLTGSRLLLPVFKEILKDISESLQAPSHPND